MPLYLLFAPTRNCTKTNAQSHHFSLLPFPSKRPYITNIPLFSYSSTPLLLVRHTLTLSSILTACTRPLRHEEHKSPIDSHQATLTSRFHSSTGRHTTKSLEAVYCCFACSHINAPRIRHTLSRSTVSSRHHGAARHLGA